MHAAVLQRPFMSPLSAQQRSAGQASTSSLQAPAAAAATHSSADRRLYITIRSVDNDSQLQDFKSMTRAYLDWLGVDLGFQGIERELASLPGSYAASVGGCMLLAYEAEGAGGGGGSSSSSSSETCVGAVALRRLVGHTSTLSEADSVAGVPLPHVCEMKRLFVLPGHHGRGAGSALVRALLTQAAQLGYQAMVLDTLDRLEGANRLYTRLGFQPCERYNDCPLHGVLYFARRLDGLGQQHPAEQQQQQESGSAAAAD